MNMPVMLVVLAPEHVPQLAVAHLQQRGQQHGISTDNPTSAEYAVSGRCVRHVTQAIVC
jgi:hypothetical protein